MKKLITILVLMALVSVAPAFALEADYIPMSFVFPSVSLDAASEAVSVVAFQVPENITIKSIYVTETDGVTANASDSATFSIKDDGSAIQTFTTNTTATALVAMTPKAFTLSTTNNAHKIAKGSVVTMAITKNGDGVALTTPVVQLNYTIGW